jgi:hypothetical protein
LTKLNLKRSLSESFNKIVICDVIFKVRLQNDENGRCEKAAVVDGHKPNLLATIPAKVSTTGLRAIHYVIPDQVACVLYLDQPSKNHKIFFLFGGQGFTFEGLRSIENCPATMEFSALCVE